MSNSYASSTTGQALSSREIAGRLQLEIENSLSTGWPFDISLYNPDSNQDSEQYPTLGMTPPLRPWKSGRNSRFLSANQIVIVNEHFESTIEDFVENFRRDKTGMLRQRVAQLNARSTTHWASILSDLMEVGDSTTIYDGSNFFAKDHEEGQSGVQANELDAAEVPNLNVAAAGAPTPEEMARILVDLATWFLRLKDDVGEPLNEDARVFDVHVPMHLASPTLQAITKTMLATAAGGAIDNPADGIGYTFRARPNPRLDQTDNRFYMFRADSPEGKAFIMQQEGPLNVRELAEGSDLEFNDNKWRFGVDTWRNAGFGMWQTAVAANLSNS